LVSFFLRAEPAAGRGAFLSSEDGVGLAQTPFGANWRLDLQPGFGATLRAASQRGSWLEVEAAVESAATERVWEVRVPIDALGVGIESRIGVAAALTRDDAIVESLPLQSLHQFILAEVA
jgi:hypothetical protein